jgi:hypothetical protein|tara:strand:+ start:5651 stop:6184 length:534 start_codon:yes stop_codon:yes gene_type:complete
MSLKKRGYFFTLDAALGLFVLTIGVFLIASFYLNVPKPIQVELLSEDLLDFLSNTKIKNLNNPYGGIGGELWKQGLITDPDNSLLQQIGEFYATDNNAIAEKFIQNISEQVIPSQFNYELWVDDVILYPSTLSAEHIKSRNDTAILLTSKKITFGIINRTTSDLWGPYKAEVYVWEK